MYDNRNDNIQTSQKCKTLPIATNTNYNQDVAPIHTGHISKDSEAVQNKKGEGFQTSTETGEKEIIPVVSTDKDLYTGSTYIYATTPNVSRENECHVPILFELHWTRKIAGT